MGVGVPNPPAQRSRALGRKDFYSHLIYQFKGNVQIREAVEDLSVRGMRVPKGTWIHVAVCAIQRDPDIWRQPVRPPAQRPLLGRWVGFFNYFVGLGMLGFNPVGS